MLSILVVEDDKGIQANLNILFKAEGYKVISAYNGLEALKKLESELPDLIISDIMMPYVDGIELYKKIKEEYNLQQTPFIFLTAKSDPVSIRQGLGLGADDYITKPFENEDVLQAIKVRLEKKKMFIDQIENLKQNLNKYVPHELRTPLVSILGFSEMMINDIDELDKDLIKEMAEKISFSGKRLLNRVDKFISVYEVELLDNKTNNEIFTAFSIIDEFFISTLINEHYFLRPIRDKIILSLEEAHLKIHKRYLSLLIKELLENATKFSASNKIINITGKIKSRYYELIISDKGIGMTKADISNISQFQQFDRDYYNQQGNGLGLSLVIKIIDLFKGKIKIKSKKEYYTYISCLIPLEKANG